MLRVFGCDIVFLMRNFTVLFLKKYLRMLFKAKKIFSVGNKIIVPFALLA